MISQWQELECNGSSKRREEFRDAGRIFLFRIPRNLLHSLAILYVLE